MLKKQVKFTDDLKCSEALPAREKAADESKVRDEGSLQGWLIPPFGNEILIENRSSTLRYEKSMRFEVITVSKQEINSNFFLPPAA